MMDPQPESTDGCTRHESCTLPRNHGSTDPEWQSLIPQHDFPQYDFLQHHFLQH